MEGYDSRENIKKCWTYRELLEMMYIEDIQTINQHIAQKKYEEEQELEELLKNG